MPIFRAFDWRALGVLLYSAGIALVFLAFATKSSPLFPFNDWVDANVHFTVGKGMLHGMVPYRDLFDHKGPLVYFLNSLGAAISPTSFTGVYVTEVVLLAVFLYYVYGSVRLFSSTGLALLAMPIMATATLNTASFTHGASAEEFSLPFMAFSLFSLVSRLRHAPHTPTSATVFLTNGMAAGCVLMMKFSLMGFWAAWLVVLLGRMAPHAPRQSTARAAGAFAGGITIAALPWLAYFQWHGAVGDFLEVYFRLNLNAYATSARVIERITVVATSLSVNAWRNPLLASLVALGCLGPLLGRGFFHADRWARAAIPLLCAGLAVSVYAGGRDYLYYFLVFAPLATAGLAFIAWCIQAHWAPPVPWVGTFTVACAVSLLWYTAAFNPNHGMRQKNKSDLVQYQWAGIINQASDKSLLNYGWLDIGLLTTTDTLPNTRFFFKSNIPDNRYPTAREQQQAYVRGQVTEFVVATTVVGHEDRFPIDPLISQHYTLVTTQTQQFESVTLRYLLFQRHKE